MSALQAEVVWRVSGHDVYHRFVETGDLAKRADADRLRELREAIVVLLDARLTSEQGDILEQRSGRAGSNL